MQQLAIIHTEPIARKAEIKYFQIPLPGLAKNIIAVETSAFLFTDLPVINTFPAVNIPPTPPPVANNNCPNPGAASIDLVNTNAAGATTTQVFRIGAAVNPGFIYSCGVYSVVIAVTAVDGDTPSSVAAKLALAVNNTSLVSWNQFGGNTRNFKPSASSNGDLLTLVVDAQHSFFVSGSGSCSAAQNPLPVSLLQYDPLFWVANNEKAGILSLQSPNATDIFYQCEVFREDRNLGFGDFTMNGQLASEWLSGRKRVATEVNILTESPILEAYYKDQWGNPYNQDVNYQLNIVIWYQKQII